MTERLVEIEVQKLPEGGYLATSPVLSGLVAQGRTLAETLEIAQGVARKLIESYREHGEPLPPGLSELSMGPGAVGSAGGCRVR
jgi:predicted RNase H-like HicB family nuclease